RFAFPSESTARKTGGLGWYILASALFVVALLSKTVTSTLPAALLLLIWSQRGGKLRAADVWPLLPWVVMGIGMGWTTAHLERTGVGAVGSAWDLSLMDRLLIAGRATWFYAAKLLWPARLTFVYPRWDLSTHRGELWLFPIAALILIASLW